MISSGGVPRIDKIKEMAYYEDIPIELKKKISKSEGLEHSQGAF